MHWLLNGFLKEVEEHGLSRESKIYDIGNLGSTDFGVVRKEGEHVRCPIDRKLCAAYVDGLKGKDNVGPSTFMLSYTGYVHKSWD